MEAVWIIALGFDLVGILMLPALYFGWKPMLVKMWYWKNKGKGAKIVDYFTSDGDHDVHCVIPDKNGAYKIKGRLHHISKDAVIWSRFYDGRMVVNKDTASGSINPVTGYVQEIPPELIEAAIIQVRNAEQKRALLRSKIGDKDWMMPAILIGVGLAVILGWLLLQGQVDVIDACKPAASTIAKNMTVLAGWGL